MTTEKVVKLQKRKAMYDNIKQESIEIFETVRGWLPKKIERTHKKNGRTQGLQLSGGQEQKKT